MPKKKTVKEEQPEISEAPEQTPEETAVPATEEQLQAEVSTEDTSLSETPPDAEQNAEDSAPQSVETEQAEQIDEEVPEDFGEPEPDKVEYDVENAPDFCGSSIDILSVSGETGDDALQAPEIPEETQTSAPEDDEPALQSVEPSPHEAEAEEIAPPTESEPQPEKPECEEHRELNSRAAERRAFFGLNFRELDRGLLPEEQQEWNAIYASYRGRSVMSGQIAGIDPRVFRVRDRRTGEIRNHTIWCAVVIPFRIPILIPETEMWARGEERPRYVMRNMGDATIDFVITDVDREKDYVVGSRRLALAARRYYFSNQPALNRIGSRVPCSVLTVSLRRLLVSCYGYDVGLTQREIDYTAIPDLTKKFQRGDTFDCVVKEYDSRANRLVLSAKELKSNPYDGADFRHPLGCSRQAMISSKYAGGVFCNLIDGVTVMCNYSFQFEDGDFEMGDRVTVVIQRYDDQKKQVYGKIVAKC